MNLKKKKRAKRRSASKSIRSIARTILHNITYNQDFALEDKANDLYPWWEGKKIGQTEIIERTKSK